MNRIGFVIKGRGFCNTFQRVKSIQQRFAWEPTRFLNQVEEFSRLTDQYGVRPSFPISTILLARYPGVAKELAKLPIDLLCHGYTHIDHTKVTRAEQQQLIGRSKAILLDNGFPIDGFRAPYLHWNEDLMETIAENGFSFDSSAVHWCLPPNVFSPDLKESEIYQRARRFYAPFFAPAGKAIRPYFLSHGLLEIPVTVPDDEILIDRLRVTDPSLLSEILLAILKQTQDDGGLFNLQLHPERIGIMKEPLEVLLKECRRKSPSIWLASLREVNHWWRHKDPSALWPHGCSSAVCVTGDIDCLTIQDFVWRFMEKN